jgi:hypothetical protein
MLIPANIARVRDPEPHIFSEPLDHKVFKLICSQKEKFNMLIKTLLIKFLVNLMS